MKKSLLACCCLALAITQSAWCGTGSYSGGDPDSVQLIVNFEYNEGNPASWAPLFREASRLLFNATEKQVKISRVTLFNNCPSLVNRADVRIFNDSQGANANVGGLGRSGTRIRLSQTHKTVTTAGPGNRGQLGLVHELGHYAFGLLDEYLDKQEADSSDAFCVDSGGVTASIMDSGTTVPTRNLRTEFCTASNHRTGRTAQDRRRANGNQFFENTDGWTWLVAWVRNHYGETLTSPASGPVQDPSGFGADPVIEVTDCGLKVSVSIDTSGSMSGSPGIAGEDAIQGEMAGERIDGEAPIDVAKQAAGKFLRLLQNNDAAGVVGVGGGVNLIPLREMSIEDRSRSLTALKSFRAKGKANWSQLLGEPMEQLVGEDGPEMQARPGNEVVLLISDGAPAAEGPSRELISPLKSRGVVVHTIGMVNDEATDLRRIATETGGNFLFARTAQEVDSHVLTVLAQVQSQGVIEDREESIAAGGSRVFQIPIDARAAEAAADFLLSWNEGDGGLQMELIDPSGKKLTAVASNASFQDDLDRKLKLYKVQQPEQGTWTVRLTNASASTRDIAFQVHALTSDVTVSSYAENSIVAAPAPLVLRTVVTTDDPVGGAMVMARITRPKGEPAEIQLFDDGKVEHADDRANDGTYSNIFSSYTGKGSYTVEVTVEAVNVFTVSAGEEDGAFTSEPVQPFKRKSKFSVVVQQDQP